MEEILQEMIEVLFLRNTTLKAKELKELLLPEIPAVGVFVNSPMDEVLALAEQKTIDFIQLHGDEDCNYILELKKHLELKYHVKIIIYKCDISNEIEINQFKEFLNKEFDVLLCTTIIETGIDISNVNTLIIYDANLFGLSQLYQIRGRVGRGEYKSYCILKYNRLLC